MDWNERKLDVNEWKRAKTDKNGLILLETIEKWTETRAKWTKMIGKWIKMIEKWTETKEKWNDEANVCIPS